MQEGWQLQADAIAGRRGPGLPVEEARPPSSCAEMHYYISSQMAALGPPADYPPQPGAPVPFCCIPNPRWSSLFLLPEMRCRGLHMHQSRRSTKIANLVAI